MAYAAFGRNDPAAAIDNFTAVPSWCTSLLGYCFS